MKNCFTKLCLRIPKSGFNHNKGQVSLEVMLIILILLSSFVVLEKTLLKSVSQISERTEQMNEFADYEKLSVFSNMFYFKGSFVSFKSFPETNVNNEVKCFSDNYYFNQKIPEIEPERRWF